MQAKQANCFLQVAQPGLPMSVQACTWFVMMLDHPKSLMIACELLEIVSVCMHSSETAQHTFVGVIMTLGCVPT